MRRTLSIMTPTAWLLIAAAGAIFFGGQLMMSGSSSMRDPASMPRDGGGPAPEGFEIATFGSGCFWCTEAVFQELSGVHSAVSGYSGGRVKNPTYREVCSGRSGHAEVIQVTFDPNVISFAELLEVFWQTHDPTTLNRQGADEGTQYRSAIFVHNDEQRQLAENYKQKLDAARAFNAPIVTEITPFTEFYPAEDYHQNYFAENGRQPYCQAIIRPKVEKLRKVFAEKLKTLPGQQPNKSP